MRICQLIASRGEGGLEKHFVEICNRLAESCEVVAVADPEYRKKLIPAVTLLPFDPTASRYNPFARRRLHKQLAEAKPDVIHAHANKAAALLRSVRHGRSARLVATVHGLKKDVSMYRDLHGIIAVSKAVAQRLPFPNVEVIYNGIIPPKPVGTPDMEHPTVVAVGRLAPVKGFDVLLKAWSSVKANLVIVGDGPERSALEKQISALNLGEKVRLLGHRNDVPDWIKTADLVVISSQRESFSYVMAEALHLRRPMVATRVGGPAEILPQSWLVPVEDAASLGKRVQLALSERTQIERDFQPVWDFAARELTMESMVQKTRAFYERITGN